MRKNLLALSIAAMIGGIAGTANAQVVADSVATISNAGRTGLVGIVNGVGVVGGIPAAATRLSPTNTGIGHILVVPYYSTQGNNTSLLNIVNTDEVNGKAVKLRYRGASNSDDVFDITIYLSPADMWSASVVRGADGVSQLITNDTSCTLPSKEAIKEKNGKFQLTRVRAANPAETREGYIEILNTADIPPTLVDVNGARTTGTASANALFNAIKHTNGVPTCASAVMDLQENALDDVANSGNRWFTRGYTFPTGRLAANWTIADVAKRSVQTGEAVAVRATPSSIIDEPGSANIVWFPQTTQVVSQTNAALLTSDPLLAPPTGAAAVKSAMYDFPDLSTPYVGVQTPNAYVNNDITSLSAMFETQSIVNEIITSGTGATEFVTDWVFTMPTRRYAVAVNYATTAGSLVFNTGVSTHFNATNVSLVNAQACVDAGSIRAWDREETTRTTFVISPDANVRFCGEASVIAFNNKPSALTAELSVNKIDTKFAEGWMRINTPGATNTSAVPVGLPVVGFAAVTYAGGALGGTWTHRTRPTRDR